MDGRRRNQTGISYGETDDYYYNIVRDPVHIHDFNATILRTMALTTKSDFQTGRYFRLTDVPVKS